MKIFSQERYMVFRKSKKGMRKGYKKRIYRKKPKFNGGTIQALKTTVVPDRLIVKLPYAQQKSFVGGVPGVTVDHQFRLNSIYDPDAEVGGHQPLGHDQWNAFYNRYRVIGAHVVARFTNRTENSAMVALIASNNITPLTDDSTLEQSRCYWNAVGGFQANATRTITKYFRLNNIVGRTRQQYMSDNDYAAPMNQNPSELINLHVVVRPDYTDAQVNCICNIKITYVCELYDRYMLQLDYHPGNDTERTVGDGTNPPFNTGVSDLGDNNP